MSRYQKNRNREKKLQGPQFSPFGKWTANLKQNHPAHTPRPTGRKILCFHQVPLDQGEVTMLVNGHPTSILIDIVAKSECSNICLRRV